MNLATRPVLLWLLIAAFWLLNANYAGVVHDAELYAFQAMAHHNPELYAGDIFLRHGSQDRFTLFTTLYSPLIGALGVENAAMVVTLLSQAVLLLVAWRLGRRITTAPLAVAGLACLLAMPNDYGPHVIFHFLENFATPRLLAEACVLAALLAVLSRRRALALATLAAGAVLHPIMTAPGFVIVAWLWEPGRRDRSWALLTLVGLALLAVAGSLHVLDAWRIDAEWQRAFDQHTDYLFLGNWELRDWTRVAATLLTLLLGARFLPEEVARRLCAVVLITALTGLALDAVGADWLRLALITQSQPYRWMWPASLLALVLLPAISAALWTRDATSRAALCGLAAAWLMRDETLGAPILLLAAALAVFAHRGVPNDVLRRWLPRFAALMLVVAAIYTLSGAALTIGGAFDQTYSVAALDRLRTFFHDTLLAVLVILPVYQARRLPPRAVAAAALLLVVICAALLPYNLAGWKRRYYDAPVIAQFGEWRRLIPLGSEVAWVESPMSTWLLLQRPSYWSVPQTGSVVFSRAAALELEERQGELLPYLVSTNVIMMNDVLRKLQGDHPHEVHTLADVCASSRANYFVTRVDLHAPPLAVAPRGVAVGYRAVRLYHCDR